MEEKSKPKFVLPSPKFDKPNGPSPATTHYLTPCGMTLLPKAKQPPPMYGARGSTVPAKFLPKEQSPKSAVPDAPPIYDSPPVPEHCYTCGMHLANSQDMKRHLEQHEPCPAENCDFAALHHILERHMEAHHITGAYKKVKKVWTAEDLAAWRAERRKKFPTAANVEQARLAKEQRIKRGERLEASKSRFGRREDRDRARGGQHKEPARPKNRHKKTLERKKNQGSSSKTLPERKQRIAVSENKSSQPPAEQQEQQLQKFPGTSQMPDFKHFKEEVKKDNNAIFGLVGMYGSDSDEESESDDEEIEKQRDEKDLETEDVTQIKPSEDSSSFAMKISENLAKNLTEEKSSVVEKDSSSDEGPEEEPIQRITETMPDLPQTDLEKAELSEEAPVEEPIQRVTEIIEETEDKPNPSEAPKPKQPEKRPPPKRVYGLNYKKARKMAPQNTMLSKLLATDIMHERNVLLQCVRHVCQSNFFGIGQPREKPPACDNS